MSTIQYTEATPIPHPCVICGRVVRYREAEFALNGEPLKTWWSAERHHAPCGAPCVGGGVNSGSSHRATSCGEDNCPGGVVPQA